MATFDNMYSSDPSLISPMSSPVFDHIFGYLVLLMIILNIIGWFFDIVLTMAITFGILKSTTDYKKVFKKLMITLGCIFGVQILSIIIFFVAVNWKSISAKFHSSNDSVTKSGTVCNVSAWFRDIDGDGVPDEWGDDFNGDGMIDQYEWHILEPVDLDNDGIDEAYVIDLDGDGGEDVLISMSVVDNVHSGDGIMITDNEGNVRTYAKDVLDIVGNSDPKGGIFGLGKYMNVVP